MECKFLVRCLIRIEKFLSIFLGIALNLEADNVGAVLMGDGLKLQYSCGILPANISAIGFEIEFRGMRQLMFVVPIVLVVCFYRNLVTW